MTGGGIGAPEPLAEAVWVLADPRAGTAAQALGIAERLGVPFRTIPLGWNRWAALPLPWPSLLGLDQAAHQALWQAAHPDAWPGGRARRFAQWPRLVISAGRRAAPVARWLRRRGARTVHCMRPGFGAADFDLLVIGGHDRPRPAPNLLAITGACHRVSPDRIAAARAEWVGLGALAAPRVALLVGGPVRGEGMPVAEAARLVPRVLRRFPTASLLVTASRRTGVAATAAIATALAGVPHVLFRWGDPGPNPYAGFLAWADAIVATGDSVSMLSEAAATAAPLLVATNVGGRQQRLVHSLYEAGRAMPLRHAKAARAATPLDETGRVAAVIRDRGWA